MKELQVETKRGVLLDGVLFNKTQNPNSVMIAITGLHGNLYSNPFYHNIGNTLNRANIDFICAHTNDAFEKIKILNVKSGQIEIIGSWNEDFNYTDEDIEAYLDFAENQGYKHIVLAGHSIGANKVIYYLSRHNDKRVEHFFLLSPANIRHLLSVVTQKEKDIIKNMYNKGDENLILPFPLLGWIKCTVKTAYGWVFNNILDNVFVEKDGDFSQVEKINIQGALLIGTCDNSTYGDPKVFLENINNHFPKAYKNNLIFIEKTGHTYQQKYQETAEEILKVLKNWEG